VAVTAHQFRLEFPEFYDTAEALIDSKLAAAARRINSAVWGALEDDAIKYLAAHLLSVHPAGESARKAQRDGKSEYYKEYRALMLIVTPRGRVT